MPELNRLDLEQFKNKPKIPVVAVLCNLRSLQNVGSIFRSADAFALQELILCGFTGRPPHRDLHKAALGAELSMPWRGWEQPLQALLDLKAEGFHLCAVEQTTSSCSLELWTPDVQQPLALVLGNEVDGLDQELLDVCDSSVEIPQWGTKHSLNVAVCAGILFWEVARKAMPNLGKG
jgi:tRNA G18 (ribose-2'-O)-methylase SpoU